jgi:hypothetical protein
VLTHLSPKQRELADYMSALSECAYRAAWMRDLEHALWRAVTEGVFQYGRLDLTAEHIQRLKTLSDACGGWIRFDEEREESFVTIAEWMERYYEPARGVP